MVTPPPFREERVAALAAEFGGRPATLEAVRIGS